MGKNFAHGADFGDVALVNDRHAVADLLHHAHFVRDDHDGNAQRAVDLPQEGENGLCGGGVEGAGGLIAEKIFGLGGQRACNRHALRLSAGELRGIRACPVGKPDQLQQLQAACVGLLPRPMGNFQREANIVQHCALLQQIEALKNHADAPPLLQQRLLAERGELFPIDPYTAGGGPLKQIDTSHERALPRAGQADHSENLSVGDGETHILQRDDAAAGGGIGF